MAIPELNAVVIQKVEVAPGLAIFRVAADGWELPEFIPGQFTVIGLPGSAPRYNYSDPEAIAEDSDKLIKRAYSIASGSKEKQYLEFYVKMINSGSLTPRLFALNNGDRLWLGPKITGMFTLNDVPEDKNIILFATGTGVAPYMSMMRSSIILHERRNYAIVHGALNSWDLGYRSELLTIERICPNFNYLPIISEPDKEPIPWTGLTGFVQRVWEEKIIQKNWATEITPENTRIFLCGHPMMITTMIDILGHDGFTEHKKSDPGNIHLERFW